MEDDAVSLMKCSAPLPFSILIKTRLLKGEIRNLQHFQIRGNSESAWEPSGVVSSGLERDVTDGLSPSSPSLGAATQRPS